MTGPRPFGRWRRLALKEIRETLRDRRTIVTLVLMPLLVYPLLGVAFQKFLLTSFRSTGQTVYLVGVENAEQRDIVEHFLLRGEMLIRLQREWNEQHARRLRRERRGESLHGSQPVGSTNSEDAEVNSVQSRFQVKIVPDVDAAVASGTVDFGVRLPPGVKFQQAKRLLAPQNQIPFEFVQVQGSPMAERGVDLAERCLEAVNSDVRAQKLERPPFSVPRHVVPAHAYRKELPAEGAAAPLSIGALVPLILILMTITGAVYPAIDLTAGERERGTLEMLVAAPVPRMGLLLAKYSTVVLVATLTATINLIAMTLTIFATGLGPFLFSDEGLSLTVVGEVFALLVLFAMFFSAVLLALTSFARSFKEAQAYLIPLMLVSIAPGVLSMIPGVKLEGFYIVLPLANIVLLSRDLIEGHAEPFAAAVVVVSTVVYALAAIMIAARIFGTDAILYGSPGTWSELFRRPEEPSDACTPLTAVLSLAVAFPLSFLSSQFAGQWFPQSILARMTASAVITALVFGGIPLTVAALRHLRMPAAFSLRNPPPAAWVAAVLLGASLWPFAYELVLLAKELGVVSVDAGLVEAARALLGRLQALPPAIVLVAYALVPAVFEELFFRGFFLSSMRTRLSDAQAVLLTAVAFAAFHVVVRHYLAVERFLPSFLLGLVLGWLCVRTGSLFPGIVLHAAHNGLLISLVYLQDTLAGLGIGVAAETHLPLSWLAAAAALAAAGFGIAWGATGNAEEMMG